MIRVTVKNRTPELMDKLQAAVSRFVGKGAFYIEGEIKSSMAEPKSGREYKRKGGKTHVASAPGESPAVDSNNLIGTIGPPIFESALEAKVGTPVEYAQYLEDGTVNMEPRPVWEKTVQEVLPTLETMLAKEIRRL
jgi:hypothetical protein